MTPARRLRPGQVVAEGRANVTSAPMRSLVLALVVAVVTGGVIALSLSDVAGIAGRYRDQIRGGRFVLVARSAATTGLDASRCDALNGLGGVRSAGAVLGARSIYPAAAPARPYELLTVTPGLVRTWFPQDVEPVVAGWVAGPEAARELGLTDRSTVAVFDSPQIKPKGAPRPVTVERILAPSPRRDEADRDLFQVSPPTGRAPTCYVDVDPASLEAVDQALTAWFASADRVGVTGLLEDRARGRTPEAELDARTSAPAWAAGTAIVTVLTVLLWYGRRDELALYRLLGASRRTVATLLAVEAVATVLVPAVVGIAFALVLRVDALTVLADPELAHTRVGSLVQLDAASLLLGLIPLPLLGTAVIVRRSPFDQLKGY